MKNRPFEGTKHVDSAPRACYTRNQFKLSTAKIRNSTYPNTTQRVGGWCEPMYVSIRNGPGSCRANRSCKIVVVAAGDATVIWARDIQTYEHRVLVALRIC